MKLSTLMLVLTLAVLFLAAPGPTAPPAVAGQVAEKDPNGDGYSPCDCHCIPWFGGKLCWCFCRVADNP